MADYRRLRVPGGTVFFTVALQERGSWLLVEEIGRLRTAVRATLAERPVEVAAWVVLPDRLHAVWRLPEGDSDFSTRWRIIKARFSRGLPVGPRRASRVARGERGLWQRRFHERHIRDDAELAAAAEYCRTNPVRHGLVERAEDWPISSFRRS